MAMRTCIYPNLAAEMARHQHTQGDVANMLGLKQAAVSTRIAGKTKWSIGEISTLCNHYGRSYEYLFTEEGKEHAANGEGS